MLCAAMPRLDVVDYRTKREVSSRELGGLREAERVPPPTAAARHAEEDIAPLWSPTHGAALN